MTESSAAMRGIACVAFCLFACAARSGERPLPPGVPAWGTLLPQDFFPFVDRYGQFRHKEWPGKIHSDAGLLAAREEEARDLAAHPGPADWDRFGGWAAGPQLKAARHFRVEKVSGKWWLVDPDGHLFWSHGPVRVTASCAETPVGGREFAFEGLPAGDSPFACFYGTHDAGLRPYYAARGILRTYDFSSANLCRKYGAAWFPSFAALAHRRLRSWGCNTLASGSDDRLAAMRQTPYVIRLELLDCKRLAGADKGRCNWLFPDPLDPSFREELARRLAAYRWALDDPWCIGFFVDNVYNWGGIPEAERQAEAYFSAVRALVKQAAPESLYLGCHFVRGARGPESILRVAARYCDALCFHLFAADVSGLALPADIDKPVLIGEFHFAALDRGLIQSGVITVADQAERGRALVRYVASALGDPRVIGAHWHQFGDEAVTGRFDGENFQDGFVDCCDSPYPETRAALREIGYRLYPARAGN